MVKFKILHLLFFPNVDLNIVALGEREGEREREIIFIPGNRSQFAPNFTFNYFLFFVETKQKYLILTRKAARGSS